MVPLRSGAKLKGVPGAEDIGPFVNLAWNTPLGASSTSGVTDPPSDASWLVPSKIRAVTCGLPVGRTTSPTSSRSGVSVPKAGNGGGRNGGGPVEHKHNLF